jgi:hypothetical protein
MGSRVIGKVPYAKIHLLGYLVYQGLPLRFGMGVTFFGGQLVATGEKNCSKVS